MTRVIRKAALLAVIGLVAAVSVATAGIPSPANSTVPTYIDLASCNGSGVVNPAMAFTVTVLDIGNFPVVNQLVSVAFNTDVKLYNAFPGFVSCQVAEATTGIDGVAHFAAIPGAGKNTNGGLTFTGASAATIYAGSVGGIVLGTSHVTTMDENGAVTTLGVEVLDLAAWGADYNARNNVGRPMMRRSDFNHLGTLDVIDLALWGAVKNGVYKAACGTLCP